VSPDGEKDNATGRDGLTQMGLASRLPGDVGIVSKLLELLRSLPNLRLTQCRYHRPTRSASC
jgi:hypothetical protein